METSEIEKTLSETRLRPPKRIYVLSAPIIYPKFHTLVLGLNPRFDRETIVLGSNATKETVLHETLHRMGLGELLTYPLAKLMALRLERKPIFPRVRERLAPRRQIKYEEHTVDSSELHKYGLQSYIRLNGYKPAELHIKLLKLIHR